MTDINKDGFIFDKCYKYTYELYKQPYSKGGM